MSAYYGGDTDLGCSSVETFSPVYEDRVNLSADSAEALKAIAPVDPLTGWACNCLTTLISGSPEIRTLCANIMQHVPHGSSPAALSDQELLDLLPSRYAQSFAEADDLRAYLDEYMKINDIDPSAVNVAAAPDPAAPDPAASTD